MTFPLVEAVKRNQAQGIKYYEFIISWSCRVCQDKKTDIRRKRLLGAVLGACVMVALMAAAIAFLLWASSEDPIPVGWLAFFIGLLVIVIIGIILALAGRIKEIKGGEQDEASKY